MNGIKIDEDQFKQLPVDEQRLAIFRAVNGQFGLCDKRFKKLERRKVVDTGAAAGGGIIGGIMTVLAYFKFWD